VAAAVGAPAGARGPAPGALVARELARAVGGAAAAPLRMLAFLARRGAHVAALERALAAPRAVAPAPMPDLPAGRPLRILVSCAEPSGELHAQNLVHALRALAAARGAPAPELVGLGGQRLGAIGVRLVGDPVSRAAMGADAAKGVAFYARLLRDVARELRAAPFDLALPIDSPALHVPLGRIARAYGVPVVHFITPQYWAWAPWRVRAYARAVDLAITILPFEPAWFEEHGVPVAHAGHPLLDALPDRAPTAPPAPAQPTLALLPGSRAGVVDRNLPWMLAAAAALRERVPELAVVLPHARSELAERLARHVAAAGAGAWAAVSAADPLHATLAGSTAALSVSGTILLDLLHHRVPAVVVYRVGGPVRAALGRRLLTVPWFASVNLLAGREVYPEFGFHGAGPRTGVVAALERALVDEAWRAECRAGMEVAAARLGPPGAVERAAAFALARVAPGGAR
jgi:lipid-A-disaccharide synthase